MKTVVRVKEKKNKTLSKEFLIDSIKKRLKEESMSVDSFDYYFNKDDIVNIVDSMIMLEILNDFDYDTLLEWYNNKTLIYKIYDDFKQYKKDEMIYENFVISLKLKYKK